MKLSHILGSLIVATSLTTGVQAQILKPLNSHSSVKKEEGRLPHPSLNPRQQYEMNGTQYSRDGEPCVFAPDLWIPNFSMKERALLDITGFQGEVEDYLLCGKENIDYYFNLFEGLQSGLVAMMPPQNFPPHLPPGQMIPSDNPAFPLSKCRFDDAFWDCDDYAYTWCRLQTDQTSCKIIFLFTYGFAHAMVTWREQNADGTWTVCIVEPSTGEKLACWQSATGSLEVPMEYWEYVRGKICAYFQLDCESWWVDSFWRYRYRDPNDWSNWLCGEDPWWKCEDQAELDFMCGELRRNGIDPCQFNPECPGCGTNGNQPPR